MAQSLDRHRRRLHGTLFLLYIALFGAVGGQSRTDVIEYSALQEIGQILIINQERQIWPIDSDPCLSSWAGITCSPDLQHIVGIQLKGLKLNGSLPLGSFAALPRLRTLDLSDNHIFGDVPSPLQLPAGLLYLDLSGNYLACQLRNLVPPLPQLQYLNLANNFLQGQLPASLGALVGLEILSIHSWSSHGSNPGVTGPLPAQLGHLSSLQALHLNGNNLTGPIPGALGQMKNLTELWLQYNRLSGPITASLGQLTKLVELQLQGNMLTGPLPGAVLSGLASLERLYVSSNAMSGPLPEEFSQLQAVVDIDLSFNDFNGSILQVFGHLPKLRRLLLGSNSLSGHVPLNLGQQVNATTLDLSHNALTGPVPSELLNFGIGASSPPQMDLMFNYLQLDAATPNQIDPAVYAFNCLEEDGSGGGSDMPARPAGSGGAAAAACTRSVAGNRTEFAINCGGAPHAAAGAAGSVNVNLPSASALALPPSYDGDDAISAAVGSYSSSGGGGGRGGAAWVLETTGLEGEIVSVLAPIEGTADQALYQSARQSSKSIAYYGLGMQPGHYLVELHFAELTFTRPGDRLFDIIIQGRTAVAQYDIYAAANGSRRAKVERFDIYLRGGPLIIHLYAGRDLIQHSPGQINGPLISAIHVRQLDTSTSPTDKPPPPPSPPRAPPLLTGDSPQASAIWAVIGGSIGGVLALAVVVGLLWLWKRQQRRERLRIQRALAGPGGKTGGAGGGGAAAGGCVVSGEIGPVFFRHAQLRAATNNFDEACKLGEGGFGAVFRGTLADGRVVAVKQLRKGSKGARKTHGIDSIHNEVTIISNLRQRNLLTLLGCCMESDCPMLVCDYMPRGSLDKWLRTTRECDGAEVAVLDWPLRFKIALGVGRGLAYLHEDSPHRIIHRDVKPANILLDEDWSPRLADFGLARLFGENETLVITSIMGTRGYVAPEYALQGQLSDKVDVYSFGVVLLELISGRKVVDLKLPQDQVLLVDATWSVLEAGLPGPGLAPFVDATLGGAYPADEVVRALCVGLWCTQPSPELRPAISQALLMLTDMVPIPPLPKRRPFHDGEFVSPFQADEWSNWASLTTMTLTTPRGGGVGGGGGLKGSAVDAVGGSIGLDKAGGAWPPLGR